ncbi:hypothetical protein ACKVMT_17440 [Halobacteriales archaeon Cl-PHB]
MSRLTGRGAFPSLTILSGLNHLAIAGDDAWHLPQHAHVIVYKPSDGGELITIYDYVTSQKPPSAQIIGNLVRVDAAQELVHRGPLVTSHNSASGRRWSARTTATG